jgi:hypothetical protein
LDPSAVPSPYPNLLTLSDPFTFDGGITWRFLVRAAVVTAVVPFDALDGLPLPVIHPTYGAPGLASVAWGDDGGGIMEIDFASALNPGQGFYILPWDKTFRGPNGEWMGPIYWVRPDIMA